MRGEMRGEMNDISKDLPGDVRAMLEHERGYPAVTASIRSRAVKRARAAVAARSSYAPVRPVRPGLRSALTGSLTVGAAIALGAAAYDVRVFLAGPSAAPLPPAITRDMGVPAAGRTAADSATPSLQPVPAEGRDQEMHLIRLARTAVAQRRFTAALAPILEHRRRFKEGRFVEEREALRVATLSGLGHGLEARRAAVEFEPRFPRSVLLPVVEQALGSGT